MITMMSNKSNYRVQTRYENPPAVASHSGKTHVWVDVSEHPSKLQANRVRTPEQRVIKICSKSEGASLVSRRYPGRRYNVVTSPDVKN